MSELSDKIAYLKGLCAGLNVEDDSPKSKLLLAIVDALEAAAGEIKALRSDHEELKEYVDVLDDDLGDLEDEIYQDSDDDLELDDDELGFDDDDDEDDEDDSEDDDGEDADGGDEDGECLCDENGEHLCDENGDCLCDECSDEHGEDGECHCGHHEHGFSDAMLDQPLTERACPACGKPISISMRTLLNRNDPIVCPYCGQKFRAQMPEDE